MEKNYKELMNDITTFIFDVDGVLTNGMVHISENGELLRNMSTRDGYAIKVAIERGYNIAIITGGDNLAVKKRLEDLGIKSVYLKKHHKLDSFKEYIKTNNISAENVLYMGDDIPDYPVMKEVGLPACPKDAVPEIQNIAKYISQKAGGDGCVRDVIEQIMKVQGKWGI
ncbi:MAG: HAD-IIIA family hydrolase [Flavobacteriaceae bacterium]|nr:HAD-IIIA family hydrolase [Flavobacteriaceae bacterium]